MMPQQKWENALHSESSKSQKKMSSTGKESSTTNTEKAMK